MTVPVGVVSFQAFAQVDRQFVMLTEHHVPGTIALADMRAGVLDVLHVLMEHIIDEKNTPEAEVVSSL